MSKCSLYILSARLHNALEIKKHSLFLLNNQCYNSDEVKPVNDLIYYRLSPLVYKS